MMTKKEAWEIVGGLSQPSKMPSYGYSIPANTCVVGAMLAKKQGSICSICYGEKGRYTFPVVKNALQRRFESLTNPNWTTAMITLLKNKSIKNKNYNPLDGVYYFRIHDVGDYQNEQHILNWVTIARECPEYRFWSPSRETHQLKRFVKKYGKLPENLIIRVSAHYPDKPVTSIEWNRTMTELLPTSTVHTSTTSVIGSSCIAYKQENQCKDCRECWNSKDNISYKIH